MVSLFALYQNPSDPSAFLAHYESVHVPLAQQMPGLLSLEWGKQQLLFSKESDSLFLVAEMRFASRSILMAALQSPEGQAAAQDLETFAAGLFTMRAVEWHE